VTETSAIRTVPAMGTFVTVQIVGYMDARDASAEYSQGVDRALGWFAAVEECCTRFDPGSELMQLCAQPFTPVPVSSLLLELVLFALAVAEETGGAFDPTIGQAMQERGFNRHYRTGELADTPVSGESASFRDIRIDVARKTITLLRPLILDLGAIAKGFAVDLAARELQPFANFAINAGGDLYLSGGNEHGEHWSVGIRHPRNDGELIDSIRVSNRAVCTSGDYEQLSPVVPGEHHILNPSTGASPHEVASVTVVAPTAVLADSLATAAFVLGPSAGVALFERLGVDGLIVTPALDRFATRGMARDYQLGSSAILPHAQGTSHHRLGDSPGVRGA
jgi:thiamine biosynthesis lipoprotein